MRAAKHYVNVEQLRPGDLITGVRHTGELYTADPPALVIAIHSSPGAGALGTGFVLWLQLSIVRTTLRTGVVTTGYEIERFVTDDHTIRDRTT